MTKSEGTKRKFKAVKTVKQLLSVYKSARPWSNIDKKGFDLNKFRVEESEHRTIHDFPALNPVGKIYSNAYDQNSYAKNLLGNVLSPSDYYFFTNPDSNDSVITYFSVHTEESKKAAIEMGYKEIKVSHLTHTHQIPLISTSTNTSSHISSTITLNGDSSISLPKIQNLKIYKSSPGEKFAVSIVRAFEVKYQYKMTDRDSNFHFSSPCLKWTNDLRRSHGLTYTNNPFFHWCTVYYAVKFLCKNTKPEDITYNSRELRSLAVKSKKKKSGLNWYDFVVEELKAIE